MNLLKWHVVYHSKCVFWRKDCTHILSLWIDSEQKPCELEQKSELNGTEWVNQSRMFSWFANPIGNQSITLCVLVLSRSLIPQNVRNFSLSKAVMEDDTTYSDHYLFWSHYPHFCAFLVRLQNGRLIEMDANRPDIGVQCMNRVPRLFSRQNPTFWAIKCSDTVHIGRVITPYTVAISLLILLQRGA